MLMLGPDHKTWMQHGCISGSSRVRHGATKGGVEEFKGDPTNTMRA